MSFTYVCVCAHVCQEMDFESNKYKMFKLLNPCVWCGVSFDTHLCKWVVRKVEERPSEATEDSAASEWLAGLNEEQTVGGHVA